jgi:hypothetical protein
MTVFKMLGNRLSSEDDPQNDYEQKMNNLQNEFIVTFDDVKILRSNNDYNALVLMKEKVEEF